MAFDNHKVILYRNQPHGWVAEIPSVPGCYALMSTPEEVLVELSQVFDMIAEEYTEEAKPLPLDTTAIVHA